MKLALGTVQFGLDYGAFNAAGQVGGDAVRAVLDAAEQAGIDTLDTARAYGESEAVLGRERAADRFRIVSKVPTLTGEADPVAAFSASVSASRAALRTDRIDTLLFHAASDLLGEQATALWTAAERAQADGEVSQLGVSVYSDAEALAVSARFPVSVVQLPVSIFDQRALRSGGLAALKEMGIEVHARSVLLQGFALADPAALPAGLAPFRDRLIAFHRIAQDAGASPIEAALAFVLEQPLIDRVVIGVQDRAQLDEALSAARHSHVLGATDLVACDDPRLLNPSLWPGRAAAANDVKEECE